MKDLTTTDYANCYMNKKLNTESWVGLDLTTREALIHEASLLIYGIHGFKFNSDVIELLTEIPDDLQQACCEVALSLSKQDVSNPHVINQNLGIKSISFGQDSASYDENANNAIMPAYLFSPYAQFILNKYIVKGFKYV
jgi:hypothetical protein